MSSLREITSDHRPRAYAAPHRPCPRIGRRAATKGTLPNQSDPARAPSARDRAGHSWQLAIVGWPTTTGEALVASGNRARNALSVTSTEAPDIAAAAMRGVT